MRVRSAKKNPTIGVVLVIGLLGLASWIYVAHGSAGNGIKLLRTINPRGWQESDGVVTSVAWNPTGQQIVACFGLGGTDCTMFSADHPSGPQWRPPLGEGTVNGLAKFSASGDRLFFGQVPNSTTPGVSVWDTKTHALKGILPSVLLRGETGDAAKAFSIAGDSTVVGFIGGGYGKPGQPKPDIIDFYDDHTLKLLKTRKVTPFVRAVALSGDAKFYAAAVNKIKIYDVAHNKKLAELKSWTRWTTFISGVSWSPNERYFVAYYNSMAPMSGRENGHWVHYPSPWPASPVFAWRTKDGLPGGVPQRPCGRSKGGAWSLAWRPKHSGEFALGLTNGEVRICSLSGKTVFEIRNSRGLMPLSFSPNGNQLAVGVGHSIKIFQIPQFKVSSE